MTDNRRMPLTQVWLSTPVDYLKVPDHLKESLIDTLLSDGSVCEVCHYSDIHVCCDLKEAPDYEVIVELQAIRSRIEMIFRSHRVWPELEEPRHES